MLRTRPRSTQDFAVGVATTCSLPRCLVVAAARVACSMHLVTECKRFLTQGPLFVVVAGMGADADAGAGAGAA